MIDDKYTKFYLAREASRVFPNEAIVRIFRGTYPRLDLKSTGFAGKKLADVGCGDGMNFLAVADLDMTLMGTEITDEICRSTSRKLASLGVDAEVRKGKNDRLPFVDQEIDILLSWNAAYYMGPEENFLGFSSYAAEFARVTKPGGHIVISVPTPGSFIFCGAKEIAPGYRLICDDPYGVRNGEVMRCFSGEEDLSSELANYFEDFRFASIRNDFFGQANHWLISVATRKNGTLPPG